MNQKQHIIYGTDYTRVGLEKVFPLTRFIVGAMTPGKKHSLRKKMDGNEDCMAVIEKGRQSLLLVADSHFGSLASKICVDQFAQLLKDEENMERALLRVHFQLDDIIREAKHKTEGQSRCSTTLVSAFWYDEVVYWASTGDSRLWLIRDGFCKDIIAMDDNDYPLFLGDDQVGLFQIVPKLEQLGIIDVVTEREEIIEVLIRLREIHELVKSGFGSTKEVQVLLGEITAVTRLEFPIPVDQLMESWHEIHLLLARYTPMMGSFKFRPNNVMLLASDGIDEAESGCSQETIVTLLEKNQPLEKRAKNLLSACMGRAGGGDNIAMLLSEFPDF